jgi:hypothetical protein
MVEFGYNSILGRCKLLDRDERLALRFGCSDPAETVKSSVSTGGFVGFRDFLMVSEKKQIYLFAGNQILILVIPV